VDKLRTLGVAAKRVMQRKASEYAVISGIINISLTLQGKSLMYLKKVLIASLLSLGLLFGTASQADNSVVIEMAWGIGGKEMPSKGIFLRLRRDKLEAHVGQWFGSAGEKNVVGLGYVMQSDEVSWTPGIAYMKGRDMVMFSRFAYEMPISETGAFEIGLLGYGTYDEVGETFATAAFKVGRNSSYEEESNSQSNNGNGGGSGGNGGDGDSGDSGGDGDSGDSGDGNDAGVGNDSGNGGDGNSGGNSGSGGDGSGDGDGGSGTGDNDGEDDDNDSDNGEQCERPGHGYGDVNHNHCFGYKM